MCPAGREAPQWCHMSLAQEGKGKLRQTGSCCCNRSTAEIIPGINPSGFLLSGVSMGSLCCMKEAKFPTIQNTHVSNQVAKPSTSVPVQKESTGRVMAIQCELGFSTFPLEMDGFWQVVLKLHKPVPEGSIWLKIQKPNLTNKNTPILFRRNSFGFRSKMDFLLGRWKWTEKFTGLRHSAKRHGLWKRCFKSLVFFFQLLPGRKCLNSQAFCFRTEWMQFSQSVDILHSGRAGSQTALGLIHLITAVPEIFLHVGTSWGCY